MGYYRQHVSRLLDRLREMKRRETPAAVKIAARRVREAFYSYAEEAWGTDLSALEEEIDRLCDLCGVD